MFHPNRTKFMGAGKTALLIVAFPLAGLIGCGSDVAGPGANPTLPAAAVTLTTAASTIRSGTSAAVSANLRDATGNSLSGRTIAWSSSDPLVATVRAESTQSATIAAVGVGEVTITASVDGVTATLTFGVTPPAGPLGRIRGFLYSASEGFVEIPAIAGTSDVSPRDINDAGQVVGSFNTGIDSHAFFWTRDGGMTDLGVPDGWNGAVATALNSAGIVVGYLYRGASAGESRAFKWSPTTGMVILPRPGNSVVTAAMDINTQGDIVGYMRTEGRDVDHPIRWSSNGAVEGIAVSRAEFGGVARAINDKGQLAGSILRPNPSNSYYESDYLSNATFWDADGTVINISNCGPDCWADANAINGSGEVAGTNGNGAFYWSRAEGVTAIGNGAGSTGSFATGINSTGQVIVNRYYDRDIPQRAFLWSRSTGMRDIGVLAGTISSRAAAINNKGQIVGYSR